MQITEYIIKRDSNVVHRFQPKFSFFLMVNN